jgi:hypothetical protein
LATDSDLSEHGLSAAWLSTKWGVDTFQIEARRRAGELVAVRPEGAHEWRFPAWQFGDDGRVRPDVERVLAAARGRGITPERLGVLLARRSGLTSRERLLDDLLAGRVEHVLVAIDRD